MKIKHIFLSTILLGFSLVTNSFAGNNLNFDNIIIELTKEEKTKIFDDIQSKFPDIALDKKQIIEHNKLKIPKYKRDYATGNRMDELLSELMKCTWLTHIVLRFAEIQKIPNSIQNLSSLKVLDLASNKLSELPEEIGSLKDLKMLNLAFNQITNIPESMKNLTSLTILNLSSNNIQSIPEIFNDFHFLKILDISYNKIDNIPDSIQNLVNLESLHLNENRLSNIRPIKGNFKNLNRLYLSNNEIEGFDETAEILGGLSNLQKLDLSYSNIGYYKEINLFEKLINLNKLMYLDLSGNALTEIPLILPENLAHLDLTSNKIRNTDNIDKHTQLRFLILNKNELDETPPKKINQMIIFFKNKNNETYYDNCSQYSYYSDYNSYDYFSDEDSDYDTSENIRLLKDYYHALDLSPLRVNRKLFAENKNPEIKTDISINYNDALEMVKELLNSINFETLINLALQPLNN